VLFARQNFFVGQDDRGFVTVYRGLDISPFGVNLYSDYCTSPLLADDVQRLKDKRLDRSSRSKEDAENLVRTMYREKLVAEERAQTPPPKKPTKDGSGSATAPAPPAVSSVPPVDQLDQACPTG
jgi:hypothetical protein